MTGPEQEDTIADRGRDTRLCALADIPDPGGWGFQVGGREPIFVIRRGNAVFGYVNVCSHMGTTLDWKPGAFLTLDKTLIQCATHGAQFDIETGACAGGPCNGRPLTAMALRIEGEFVMLDE
jgi:nitrite reductase/ring-hydroxylating ferredoxin subunit